MASRKTAVANTKRRPAKKPTRKQVPSIARQIVEIGRAIPDAEVADIPTDTARNLDHYLYGAPKRP